MNADDVTPPPPAWRRERRGFVHSSEGVKEKQKIMKRKQPRVYIAWGAFDDRWVERGVQSLYELNVKMRTTVASAENCN